MKKKKKKKFHARVEIYFVIYLATIISFFSVEGEIREYKQKQEKTILAISRDKVAQLVSIGRIDPVHDKKTLTLNVKLEGFFEKQSLKGDVLFRRSEEGMEVETDKVDYKYKLNPLHEDIEDTWFSATIPKSDFGKETDIPYEVTAEISVKPQFNEEVKQKWMESYEDEHIVEKLIHAISSIGRISLNKTFPNKIIPVSKKTVSPFTMQVARRSYTVLQGISWKVPIFIGGVKNKSDFRISVVSGSELVGDKFINTPETRLSGTGIKDGKIKLLATRLSDNKKTSVEFDINVRPPVWTIAPSIKQVYLGENYTFDGSLRDIPSGEIEIQITGSAVEEQTIGGAQIALGPFEKEGNIHYQVIVAGSPIESMEHSVTVLKPPPPDIKLFSRDPGSNNVIFEIVTYGRANKVLRFQQRGGIVRNQQMDEPDVRGSKKYYKWLVEIEEPFDKSAFQEISFKIWDNIKQFSSHRKQYQYNY